MAKPIFSYWHYLPLPAFIGPDKTNVNYEIVRAGFAWWYRRYSIATTMEQLEAEARKAKRKKKLFRPIVAEE